MSTTVVKAAGPTATSMDAGKLFSRLAQLLTPVANAYAKSDPDPDEIKLQLYGGIYGAALVREGDLLKDLSAPQRLRLQNFFQAIEFFGKGITDGIGQFLTQNHKATFKAILDEIDTSLEKPKNITLTNKPETKWVGHSRSKPTEGTIQFGDTVYQFRAETTYASGSSYCYYELTLKDPNSGFDYYYKNVAETIESKLGGQDLSLYDAQYKGAADKLSWLVSKLAPL